MSRILKIETLPSKKEWVDKDHIMLHACFQLLVDCVEQEELDKHCNYEVHKEKVDEVRFLYNWWKNRNQDKEWYHTTEEDDEMLLRLIKIRHFLWT